MTHADYYRKKSKQADPLTRDKQTAQKSQQADQNKRRKTEVLTGDYMPAMESLARLRIEQHQHENVVNVRRGKRNASFSNSRDYIVHSFPWYELL